MKISAVKKTNYVPQSEQESWIGILYACLSVDGNFYDAEIDALTKVFVHKSFFDRYDFMDIFKRVENATKIHGNKVIIDHCIDLISPENVNTVYCTAVKLAYADGIMRDKQKDLLNYLATKLNMTQSEAETINRVLGDLFKYEKEMTEDFIEQESSNL